MNTDMACAALQDGRVLEITYNGLPRRVEVHAVGVTKSGAVVMCCWQTDGGSSSGEQVGWKLMTLDDITAARISDESSGGPRPGYRRGDSRMTRIICEL